MFDFKKPNRCSDEWNKLQTFEKEMNNLLLSHVYAPIFQQKCTMTTIYMNKRRYPYLLLLLWTSSFHMNMSYTHVTFRSHLRWLLNVFVIAFLTRVFVSLTRKMIFGPPSSYHRKKRNCNWHNNCKSLDSLNYQAQVLLPLRPRGRDFGVIGRGVAPDGSNYEYEHYQCSHSIKLAAPSALLL